MCNNHLEWFKEMIKATQESIEFATISKVKDINEWGQCFIYSLEEKPLLSTVDAITLKILHPNAAKSEYSLDDLQDLESELYLIKGNTSGTIAKFLNVCAC